MIDNLEDYRKEFPSGKLDLNEPLVAISPTEQACKGLIVLAIINQILGQYDVNTINRN